VLPPSAAKGSKGQGKKQPKVNKKKRSRDVPSPPPLSDDDTVEPPKQKQKKTHDALELIALHKALPAGAQKEGYDGTNKSYTLRDPSLTGAFHATIGVLVDKQTFYVCPVAELPKKFEGRYKINIQDCFFLNVF